MKYLPLFIPFFAALVFLSLMWFAARPDFSWIKPIGNFHAKRRFNKFGHVLADLDFKVYETKDIFDEPDEHFIQASFESLKPLAIRTSLAGLLGAKLKFINDRCSSGRSTHYMTTAGMAGQISYSVMIRIDPFILPYIQTYVKLKS